MLITLPENKNTGKTISTVHSLMERGSVLSSQPSLYSRGAGRKLLQYEAAKSGLILKTIIFEVLIFVSS